MAGKNRRGRERQGGEKSSVFSMMNFFKFQLPKRSRDREEGGETSHVRKPRPSDEDRGRFFAEPDIDRKATAFIARFYETRVMDAERQTVKV
ncbi:hypothetical protein H6P81_004498 [Aristolochia fimbriata]|uniref:Uncharacterized protein n=1 Tax=Aristolochia fimbriata TaxID=158543 RepID=A0AAV7FFJ0_ARIFI|nr:hypothetical protein H6P81_004498 [Aristolochia fimbriata]